MGRVTVRRLTWVIGLSAVLLSTPAFGDSPERRANAAYNEAKALISAGALGAAAAKLTEAWSIFEHPLIMKKRAEVQQQRKEYKKAVADFRIYETRLSKRKKKERAEVAATIAALEAIIAKPVQLRVQVTSGDALVSLNGQAPKTAPFTIALLGGEHTLTIDDPRFERAETTVVVRPGIPQSVTLTPVLRTGRVVIRTDRENFLETSVLIDDTPLLSQVADRSNAQLPPVPLPIGRHTLTCSIPGTPQFKTEFVVTADARTEVLCNFELVDPSVAGDTWGWVTAGSGIAATIAGVGLLASYGADVQLAEDRNQDLVTDKHIIGGVLLGVGVGLAVGSYFVFTRDRGTAEVESEAQHSVEPQVMWLNGGALFGAGGRF